MYINEDTKISALIKHNFNSIEAIASISKNFEKLKIPVLRKLLASRVSIKQAAKIGNSSIQTFYDKLIPLGFMIKESKRQTPIVSEEIPEFYVNIDLEKITELDVRSILNEGKDPFKDIMTSLEKLPSGHTLNIINSFEPTPLINILSKKGYVHYVDRIDETLVHTYLQKNSTITSETKPKYALGKSSDMQEIIDRYGDKIEKLDVRELEMPLPMSTILNKLEELAENHLLYVNHKKIPKFLFPELAERGYKWFIDEIGEGNVKILIYK